MTPLRPKLEQNVGWIVLALLLLGCLWVMRPFVSALLWAVVLSFSTWPIYGWLLKVLRGQRTIAAGLMTLAMVLTMLLPFVIVGITLADSVKDLTTATRHWLDAGPPDPPAWLVKVPVIGVSATERWKDLAGDSAKLVEVAKRFIEPVSTRVLQVGIRLGGGLFDLALSILVTFFLLRDGVFLAEWLTASVNRIAGEQGKHLLEVAGKTVRGVVYGILGTALVQAAMAAFGFVIAGVPGAALLALLLFFMSVVPAGPFMIILPAALWLFHQGATGWGIFMLIWGVIVSTVDNFVKPWLISQGNPMPFLLIFFGVLGGALGFGFIGVFLGPTLLAVGYRLLKEWAATTKSQSAIGL
jgi:predicted PurR-regulated permease PerM